MTLRFQEHHLYQILNGFDLQHLPLDLFLSLYFRSHKSLGSKDRRFIAENVYGMVRWRSLLDHLASPSKSWESRYAIYQGFQPTNYLTVNSIPPHVRVSFPQVLFSFLFQQYGEEKAIRLCQICNTPAPTTVRINPLKTTRDQLFSSWNQKYDVTPCEHSELGIQFKKRIPFFELKEFKAGFFEVQDEGSQLIADKVKPAPGDQVLDYCAGSGGKTLAFAHQMQGRGQVYLHDIRPFALQQARKRVNRSGFQNVQFLTPMHPLLDKLKRKMDWVLADVPCSGTGTLRRNPDMKWKFDQALVQRLVGEQRTIFEKALSFVKPGGKIVYATCSILSQENEEQLAHFIKTYDLKMVGDPFCSLPSFGGMDGFFAVTLERT